MRIYPAPAKLNLFLHIVGRRPDGYHLLQTVFQFLDLADELGFAVLQDGTIRRLSELRGVDPDADLVVRAARLLQAESGTRLGAEITVEKRIPLGGGLGGGSSDAATTLVALNELWGTGFSTERLAALGLRLGADVPVFVHGRAAWAEGVGEQLIAIDPPEPWYLVLVPPCHVPTARIFGAAQLTRDSTRMKIGDFLAGAPTGNVCEPVVREWYPEVAAALDWLAQHAKPRLTGTGACVFAAFEEEDAARAVLARVPSQWRGLVARGRNVSPLYAALSTQAGIA